MKIFNISMLTSAVLSLSLLTCSTHAMNNNNKIEDSVPHHKNNRNMRKRRFNQLDVQELRHKKLKTEINNYVAQMEDLSRGNMNCSDDIINQIKCFILEQDPETGNTLLHSALNFSHYLLINTILETCSHEQLETLINIPNASDHTPLHIAIHKNNLPFVRSVLGLPLGLKKFHKNPLHFDIDIIEEVRSLACSLRYREMIDNLDDYLHESYSNQKENAYSLLMRREINPADSQSRLKQHFAPSKIALKAKETLEQLSQNIDSPEKIRAAQKYLFENDLLPDHEFTFIQACQGNNDIDWIRMQFSSEISQEIILQKLSSEERESFLLFRQLFFAPAASPDQKRKSLDEFVSKNYTWIVEKFPSYTGGLFCYASRFAEDAIPSIVKHFNTTLTLHLNKTSLLHDCITANISLENFNLILSLNPNINLQNSNGNTLLHLAIGRRRADYINALLKYNPDLTIKNHMGCSPLSAAANEIIESDDRNDNFNTALFNLLKQASVFMTIDQIKKILTTELKPVIERIFPEEEDQISYFDDMNEVINELKEASF